MMSFFELKKKALKKQKEIMNKRRKKQEESLRKDIELAKLKKEAQDARKLKLSPEERKYFERKVEAKKKQSDTVKKRLKFLGKGLKNLAINISNDVEKAYGNKKPKKKPKPHKGKKNKRRSRK